MIVRHLHVAPASRLPMVEVAWVEVRTGGGIVGDRYEFSRHRHLTVQALDELDAAAADLGSEVSPGSTRRNVTVDAGPLPDRPGEGLRVGEVELEVVRVAAPCRLLDDTIGSGARRALRRRAGVVYRVRSGGVITAGDEAWPIVGGVAMTPGGDGEGR